MEKTCRTCDYWLVSGRGEYGKAMFPGSWGTERRDPENRQCRCVQDLGEMTPRWANEECGLWTQARDIVDECSLCGALCFEYDRPGTPNSKVEFEHGGKVRFWWPETGDCEHEGVNHHGLNPWDCGMCQGGGDYILGNGESPGKV